jgi:hypothetical protein
MTPGCKKCYHHLYCYSSWQNNYVLATQEKLSPVPVRCPNVANFHQPKAPCSRQSPAFGGTAALGREFGPKGPRLGQDLAHGIVHFVLTETVRSAFPPSAGTHSEAFLLGTGVILG